MAPRTKRHGHLQNAHIQRQPQSLQQPPQQPLQQPPQQPLQQPPQQPLQQPLQQPPQQPLQQPPQQPLQQPPQQPPVHYSAEQPQQENDNIFTATPSCSTAQRESLALLRSFNVRTNSQQIQAYTGRSVESCSVFTNSHNPLLSSPSPPPP